MNTYPNSCTECCFYRSCNSGMHMNGCAFYSSKDKREFKIKSFFSKFFSK